MENIDQLRMDLKSQGYAIIRYDSIAIHSYPYDSPWLLDQKFNDIFDRIRSNTLVDRVRCYSLYLLMEQVAKIPGDILEVGTWRGGTAGIFTQLAPEKMVYLADTFTGVVKSSDWEHYRDGAHSDTSEALVGEFLTAQIGISNFRILKGIFPDETGHSVMNKKFSFVYLDLDVYKSTKDAFNFIWDSLSINGVVAFDDYGFTSACSGIKKFVDEIKSDPDKLFIQNLNGQAYVVKIDKSLV